MKLAILGTRGDSRRVRRLRDARRGALGPPRRPRARRHGLRAAARRRLRRHDPPRGARRPPSDDPPEVPRHRRPFGALGSPCRRGGLRRRPRLQRRQRPPLPPAPPPRRADAHRPERGRARAEPPEVERLGQLVYALSERLSCVMPDAVVTDARAIQAYYREQLRKGVRLHPVRLRPPASHVSRDARAARALARRLRALRLALRAGEQRGRRRPRVPRACRARRSSSSSARRRTRTPFSRGSAPRPLSIRASSCPGRFTARRTASSSRTPRSTCTRRRSAARTPRSSRRWASAGRSSSTTPPRIARRRGMPRSS